MVKLSNKFTLSDGKEVEFFYQGEHSKGREVDMEAAAQSVREMRANLLGFSTPDWDTGFKAQQPKLYEWHTACRLCGISMFYVATGPRHEVQWCDRCRQEVS